MGFLFTILYCQSNILTFHVFMRSNHMFDKCEVVKEDLVEMMVRPGEVHCQHVEDTRICLSIIETIPSCVLKIYKVTNVLTGSWRFDLKKQQSGENSRYIVNIYWLLVHVLNIDHILFDKWFTYSLFCFVGYHIRNHTQVRNKWAESFLSW